jgi:hypothetical protein
METKTIEVCTAICYAISCEHNDSVDIRAGGPPVLGYDFYVSPDEDEEEMKRFLEGCIKKYRRPFMGISTYKRKNFPVRNLWTKKMMEECIRNNAI